MRDSLKPTSLNELMGGGLEHKQDLDLHDLPKLLGEKMPEIEYNRVGKIRLIQALHNRFGAGFGEIPGVQGLLKKFDHEAKLRNVIRMNRKARNG